MREAGELTDVVLAPEHEPYEFAIEKLRAHKCFLAAVVPHVRDGLLSGMAESKSGVYPFDGSLFGACSMLG